MKFQIALLASLAGSAGAAEQVFCSDADNVCVDFLGSSAGLKLYPSGASKDKFTCEPEPGVDCTVVNTNNPNGEGTCSDGPCNPDPFHTPMCIGEKCQHDESQTCNSDDDCNRFTCDDTPGIACTAGGTECGDRKCLQDGAPNYMMLQQGKLVEKTKQGKVVDSFKLAGASGSWSPLLAVTVEEVYQRNSVNVRTCTGGTNDGTACPNGDECTGGGTCGVIRTCTGGTNNGAACPLGTECTGGGTCDRGDNNDQSSIAYWTTTFTKSGLTTKKKDVDFIMKVALARETVSDFWVDDCADCGLLKTCDWDVNSAFLSGKATPTYTRARLTDGSDQTSSATVDNNGFCTGGTTQCHTGGNTGATESPTGLTYASCDGLSPNGLGASGTCSADNVANNNGYCSGSISTPCNTDTTVNYALCALGTCLVLDDDACKDNDDGIGAQSATCDETCTTDHTPSPAQTSGGCIKTLASGTVVHNSLQGTTYSGNTNICRDVDTDFVCKDLATMENTPDGTARDWGVTTDYPSSITLVGDTRDDTDDWVRCLDSNVELVQDSLKYSFTVTGWQTAGGVEGNHLEYSHNVKTRNSDTEYTVSRTSNKNSVVGPTDPAADGIDPHEEPTTDPASTHVVAAFEGAGDLMAPVRDNNDNLVKITDEVQGSKIIFTYEFAAAATHAGGQLSYDPEVRLASSLVPRSTNTAEAGIDIVEGEHEDDARAFGFSAASSALPSVALLAGLALALLF